jgi:hypothetical protein
MPSLPQPSTFSPNSSERALELACHPASRTDCVAGIEARVFRKGALLAVSFSIRGALERLRVPEPRATRIGERLWQHTCCELFIARAGERAYHEFNFSPSTEWAVYQFSGYREGGPLSEPALNPHIAVRSARETLELQATVDLARLSSTHATDRLCLGLSSVMEDLDGTLTYWALKHAPGKPDFHHPGAFALEL